MNVVHISIFPDELLNFTCVPWIFQSTVCLFLQCSFCHIHREYYEYRHSSQSPVEPLLVPLS